MADPAAPGRFRWLWLLIILVLVIVIIVWLTRPSSQVASGPAGEPTAPSSEFVGAPTEPGVPVTLPTTPMTNVPPSPTPSPAP